MYITSRYTYTRIRGGNRLSRQKQTSRKKKENERKKERKNNEN